MFPLDVMSFSFGSSPQLLGDAVLLAVARDARVPPAAGRDVTAVPGGVRGSALLGTAVTQGAGFLSCRSLRSLLPWGGGWRKADGCGAAGTGLAARRSPTTAAAPRHRVPRSPAFLGARFGPWLLRCGPVCVHFLGYFSLFLVPWRVPSLISRSLFMLLSNFFCCS